MPQLFPMNWMFMTLTFSLLFIFVSALIFFFPMTSLKTTFVNKCKNNKMFKW
uniref:ATP synthase F0 subunit 8 n=1 Tax=Ixodes trichosuri TaxID=262306 RepID=UPI001FF35C1E|nr:ATP synthase F0 subunit 8 [Ixodes trichosuri]UOK09894.1 ATP synthase subunit 8 [Ixodes trichosuri]